MSKKFQFLFAVLVLLSVILITACGPLGERPNGIGNQTAIGRGVISNIEPLNNGLFQIWIFGDSTYVYCTLDVALIETAKRILTEKDATIIYTYRDWKEDDPEYVAKLTSTCGQGYTGTRGSKFMSVTAVNPGE